MASSEKGKTANAVGSMIMPGEVLYVCVRSSREFNRFSSLMDSTIQAVHLYISEPYVNCYKYQLPVMVMDVLWDGVVLACGSADKCVKIWGLTSGLP